jgi:two-component system, NtrC family, response regulator HydG
LGTTEWILPEDLPEALLESELNTGKTVTTYHRAVVQQKKEIILRALDQSNGDRVAAARLLGIHPNYLDRLIRNLNLTDQLKSAARQ